MTVWSYSCIRTQDTAGTGRGAARVRRAGPPALPRPRRYGYTMPSRRLCNLAAHLGGVHATVTADDSAAANEIAEKGEALGIKFYLFCFTDLFGV